MGSINYGSNKYINIGVNVSDIYEGMKEDILWLYEEIENLLNDYYFYYFNIEIKEGYYSGFYIDIDAESGIYENYIDKLEAQKEITQIKKFLLRCVGFGLVKYSPGWCTGYYNAAETKNAIKEAVKILRSDIKKYDYV